jgi:rhomboid protease GlpG
MRLLSEMADRAEAAHFSNFLKSEHIENRVEEHEGHFLIWVQEEEQVEAARAALTEFCSDPSSAKFKGREEGALAFEQAKVKRQQQIAAADVRIARKPRWGWVTILIVLICGAIYLGGSLQRSQSENPHGPLIFTSPIYAALLYDFPHTFQMLETLHQQHDLEAPGAEQLLKGADATPYWHGFYLTLLQAFGREEGMQQGPLFEQIQKGEVWRLITPVFLHADLFHILFNMLWLVVLGNQIEYRIGTVRYLLLSFIAALITNAAQYLMSGPAFLGYSGVVLALLGFIWMRQRRAPWEGYLLARATVIFISIYVFGLLGIQLVSFGLEIAGREALFGGIANTAHIVGAITGAFLGRFKLFAINSNL